MPLHPLFAQELQSALSDYVQDIKASIHQNWQPPRLQTSEKVEIQFTINRQGELGEVYLTKPSDNVDINIAALNAVKSSAPFNAIPAEIEDVTLTIVYAFEYDVLDDEQMRTVDIAQYLNILKDRLIMKWNILGASRELSTVVNFYITPEGLISNPKITTSSGSKQYDSLIVKTLEDVSPFYKLPAGYTEAIQITAKFDYKDNPVITLVKADDDLVIEQTRIIDPDVDFTPCHPEEGQLDPLSTSADYIDRSELGKLFVDSWAGKIVTPAATTMPMTFRYINDSLFITIGSETYLANNLEILKNNQLKFFINMGRQSKSELHFLGTLYDNEFKGTAIDNTGVEGYWYIKNK
jgi:TonB family protein